MLRVANSRTRKTGFLVLLLLFVVWHASAQSTASRLVKGPKVYICGFEKDTFKTAAEGCKHWVKVHYGEGHYLVKVEEAPDGNVTCACKQNGREETWEAQPIYGETICPQFASEVNNDQPWKSRMCECPEGYVAENNRCVDRETATSKPTEKTKPTTSAQPTLPPKEVPDATPKDKTSTLKPGPYAKGSIPARGPEKTFTSDERAKINKLGKEDGCHTCGSKDPKTASGNFIPDHQPPSALNKDNKPQILLPHCHGCSRLQGGQVNGALTRKQ
ncbi:MAG: hypothetical protein H7Z21_18530 [Hymenobacter sp.]|nr:hypothetical protein [Hymenobacter sp.]